MLINTESFKSIDYDVFVDRNIRKESGQAKILVSTLQALVELKTPELNIIVIGSASSRNVASGMTYDSIAMYFTQLGYHGEIDLYDPDELEQVYKLGDFTIRCYQQKVVEFNKPLLMTCGKTPTLILDDAWVPSQEVIITPEQRVSIRPLRDLRNGLYKFVVKKQGDQFFIEANLDRHKTGIGGGMIYCFHTNKKIMVWGTSSHVGPYNKSVVESILAASFTDYEISVSYPSKHSVRAHDPDFLIVRSNPGVRVCTKYYPTDKIENGRIIDQYFYVGIEQRALFNVPEMTRSLQFGDMCPHCLILGKISACITTFNNCRPSHVVESCLSSIIGYTCFRREGQKFQQMVEFVLNMAKRQLDEATAKQYFIEKFFNLHSWNRALRYTGSVSVVRYVPTPDFNKYSSVKKLKQGEHHKKFPVHQAKDGSYCQLWAYWRYYDSKGIEVKTQTSRLRLLHSVRYNKKRRIQTEVLSSIVTEIMKYHGTFHDVIIVDAANDIFLDLASQYGRDVLFCGNENTTYPYQVTHMLPGHSRDHMLSAYMPVLHHNNYILWKNKMEMEPLTKDYSQCSVCYTYFCGVGVCQACS